MLVQSPLMILMSVTISINGEEPRDIPPAEQYELRSKPDRLASDRRRDLRRLPSTDFIAQVLSIEPTGGFSSLARRGSSQYVLHCYERDIQKVGSIPVDSCSIHDCVNRSNRRPIACPIRCRARSWIDRSRGVALPRSSYFARARLHDTLRNSRSTRRLLFVFFRRVALVLDPRDLAPDVFAARARELGASTIYPSVD